jgi:hypothetical protein
VFEQWWSGTARSEYLGFTDGQPASEVTFYYDPSIDHYHRLPVGRAGLFPAYFLAPQKPAEARALFEAGLAQSGALDPSAANEPLSPQRTPMIIHLAREWGLDNLADRLQLAANDAYEPSWDRERGEFTWGFQLDEEHPRGQFNASMAAAEAVSEGAWWHLFNVGPGNRFDQPTVTGIDFPDLTVTTAWWDTETPQLLVGTVPRNSRVVGRPTRFKIVNLEDASAWKLESDDALPVTVHAVGGELHVATTIDSHRFVLRRV